MTVIHILALAIYNSVLLTGSLYFSFVYIGRVLFSTQSPGYGVGSEIVFIPLIAMLASTMIGLLVLIANYFLLRTIYSRIEKLKQVRSEIKKHYVVASLLAILITIFVYISY